MTRLARTATAVAAAALLVVGLSGCGAISNLITGEDDVFTIAVGDCFDSNEETESGEEITSVPTIDCEKKHDFEAYRSVKMDQDSYPGETDTTSQAESQCLDGFEGFIGASYDDAVAYDFTYFYPSSASWAMGDREILCMAFAIDENGDIEKVTGTLEGAES